MQHQLPAAEVGVWRKEQVYTGRQTMPAPQHVANLMTEWETQVQEVLQKPPLKVDALRTLFFKGLCIHPFIDGNGRIFTFG